jgi:hypothetical protein
MAERHIGRGFGRGVFGRAHNGFVATFAASVFTEAAHDDIAFELPPEFEVYIAYNETPSGLALRVSSSGLRRCSCEGQV